MRALPYGILFSTDEPSDTIESWLVQHADGAYSLQVDGVSQLGPSRSVRLFFESKADRSRFRETFICLDAPAPTA